MQNQHWALALGEVGAAWPIYASCRRALSSTVGLTACLHTLPLPGLCFLLECLGGGIVPWLHLCQGNELHRAESSAAQNFAPQGQHLGPGFSQAQAWVFAPSGTFQTHKFSIRPNSLSYPRPMTLPPSAPKVETPRPMASRPLLPVHPSNQPQGSAGSTPQASLPPFTL